MPGTSLPSLSEQKKKPNTLLQCGFTFLSHYIHKNPVKICEYPFCPTHTQRYLVQLQAPWKADHCFKRELTSNMFKVPNLFLFLQSNSFPLSKLLSNKTLYTNKLQSPTTQLMVPRLITIPLTLELSTWLSERLLNTVKIPHQAVCNKTWQFKLTAHWGTYQTLLNLKSGHRELSILW